MRGGGAGMLAYGQVTSSEDVAVKEEIDEKMLELAAFGGAVTRAISPSASSPRGGDKSPQKQMSEEDHEKAEDRRVGKFGDTNWLTDEWPVSLFCNSKGFLLVLCLYVLVQSCVVNGLYPANISSIQQRYNLSATTIGVLAALSDIAVVAVASIVGYAGSRSHIPRWLGLGSLLVGFGSACFFIAWLAGGQYDIPLRFSKDACTPGSIQPDCTDKTTSVLFLFIIGQVLLGLGSTPAYALGPSYLDQIVKSKALPIHLGFFYAAASVGPAIGFGVAGGFLTMWVDPGNQPNSISTRNFEWIGNWWAGFLIASGCSIAISFLLFLFPHYVPHTRWIRQQKQTYLNSLSTEITNSKLKNFWDHIKLFFVHMKKLFTNPTFIFTALAQSVITFAASGFGVFLPKLAQSMFNLSASYASLVVGLLIVFSAAGGTLFGGWLVKKVRWHLRPMALFSVVITTIAFLLMLGFFFYGCNTLSLAGVTTNYEGLTERVGLSSSCNSVCSGGCDVDKYSPTCGDDGINYFNPCFAGCQVVTSGGGSEDPFFFDARYANCTCVFNGLGGAGKGRCDTGCDDFKPFMAILFFIMFVLFMTNAPSVTVLLRSLDSDVRHLGMSVQNVVFRVLGSIPGPIIFGQLIDGSCALHATTCGGTKEGTCLEFDITDLRRTIYAVASISSAFAIVFFSLAWYFWQCPPNEMPFDIKRELDTNGDGKLSMEEINAWIADAEMLTCGFSNEKAAVNVPAGTTKQQRKSVKTTELKRDKKAFHDFGVTLSHEQETFLASVAVMRNTIDSGTWNGLKLTQPKGQAEQLPKDPKQIDVLLDPLQKFVDRLAQENEMHHTALRKAAKKKKAQVIDEIFDLLDTDNNKKLSREELERWVKSEPEWEAYARNEKIELSKVARMVSSAPITAKGYADKASLQEFFATWPLRQLRKFTEATRKNVINVPPPSSNNAPANSSDDTLPPLPERLPSPSAQ